MARSAQAPPPPYMVHILIAAAEADPHTQCESLDMTLRRIYLETKTYMELAGTHSPNIDRRAATRIHGTTPNGIRVHFDASQVKYVPLIDPHLAEIDAEAPFRSNILGVMYPTKTGDVHKWPPQSADMPPRPSLKERIVKLPYHQYRLNYGGVEFGYQEFATPWTKGIEKRVFHVFGHGNGEIVAVKVVSALGSREHDVLLSGSEFAKITKCNPFFLRFMALENAAEVHLISCRAAAPGAWTARDFAEEFHKDYDIKVHAATGDHGHEVEWDDNSRQWHPSHIFVNSESDGPDQLDGLVTIEPPGRRRVESDE